MDILRSSTPSSGILSGSVVVSLLATLLVTSVLALFVLLQRRKQLRPPGPFVWPVVGNFPSLAGALKHRVLQALAAKYGGLMYLQLGSVPVIVVSTVAVSRELFQTHDATFLDRPKGMVLDIMSNKYKNMIVANGLRWRQLRKLCALELFSVKSMATYQQGRTEEMHIMMKELVEDCTKDGNSSKVVNLRTWLRGVTANHMSRMLLNKRYFGNSGDSKKQQEDFGSLISRSFQIISTLIISDFVPSLSFITKFQGWPKKLEALQEWTYSMADGMIEIERHRQRAELEKEAFTDENYVPDFLDLLLRTPLDDGKILPDKNLILVMFFDLMYPGTETSATASEWALAELVTHPSVMRKLQDELTTVIGPNNVPQESDILRLPFLQAVVKETFRLHPPVTLNPFREARHAFQFQGFHFPKHTRLMINFYAIHRDPSVWESPDDFKPERFMERPEVNPVNGFSFYELTPFSAGRRMCPAASLGYTTVCSLVAHLVHAFEWEVPQHAPLDFEEQFALSVNKKTPLRLVARPKSPAFVY